MAKSIGLLLILRYYSAIATATGGAFWLIDRQNWRAHMRNWRHWALTYMSQSPQVVVAWLKIGQIYA